MRSWLFGHHIATHAPDLSHANVDAELHAVTAILHDLGWSASPTFISPDKRFEVDGANATRDFILRETEGKGWDAHRLQLAWDAVALHTSASIALYKQPEVKACCVGIFADFVGWQGSYGGVMSADVWDGIILLLVFFTSNHLSPPFIPKSNTIPAFTSNLSQLLLHSFILL